MEQLVNFKILYALVASIFFVGCSNTQKEFYENGNMKSIIKLNSDNNFHGEATFYFENGNIEKTVSYNNGYIKKCVVFYENGGIMWQAPYMNNKKNGEYIEFYPNNKIKKRINFSSDTILNSIEYDTLDNIIMEYVLIDTNKLPPFDTNFIFLTTDKNMDKIKLSIPNIPSSQLLPEIINGEARVIDRINGLWEVRPIRKDKPTQIGLRIQLENNVYYTLGYNRYDLN